MGRCKFRLTTQSVGALLQSVLGGHSHAFRVVQLGDQVFRFSISSKSVGFHIVKLRSFECSDFKIFHLWHDGGPNYVSELHNWEAEQASKWSGVVKRARPPQHQPILIGANAIPVHDHHRLPWSFQILNLALILVGNQLLSILILVIKALCPLALLLNGYQFPRPLTSSFCVRAFLAQCLIHI